MNIGDIKYIAYLDDIKELEGKLDEEFDSVIKEMENMIKNTPDVFHDAPQSSVKEEMVPSDFDYGLTLCGHGDTGNFPSIGDYGVSLTLRGKNISYAQIFITRHGDIWSRRSSIIDEWNGEWYSVANEIDKKADVKELKKIEAKLENKVNLEVIGDLNDLSTKDKSNLVHAINEVKDGFLVEQREPTVDDISYNIGQMWYSKQTRNIYILNNVDEYGATWDIFLKSSHISPAETKVYGVVIDNNNSNPETRVEYTDDAVGFKPLRGNDGNTDWGSWKDTWVYDKFRPCIVEDGEVQYYLNKENMTEKEDGSSANLTGRDGDVMIEIDKIWIRLENSGDKQYIKISSIEREGFQCLAHTNGDKEVDKIYVGAFVGSKWVRGLRSVELEQPETNHTLSEFRKLAEKQGENYHLMPFYPLLLLQSVATIMLKSTDSQKALGSGCVDRDEINKTGRAIDEDFCYGTKDGDSYFSSVKFMGIEDLWGNVSTVIEGLFIGDTSDGYIYTATNNFNDKGEGYTKVGKYETRYGYPQAVVGTNEIGFLRDYEDKDGSNSTYYCDYQSILLNKTYVHGGDHTSGRRAGLYSINNIRLDEKDVKVGARLFMYGK